MTRYNENEDEETTLPPSLQYPEPDATDIDSTSDLNGNFDSTSDDQPFPALGPEDEAALDIAPPPRPNSPLQGGTFEPDTIFDADPSDAAPPPRELLISPEAEAYAPAVGDVLNERFEIMKLIGVGVLGTVYLVDDLRLKDKKALKLMHPALMKSPNAADRFLAEIKTLQQLSHENIVRVYDFGKTDGSNLSFFTMEYVEGVTLAALLKKKGGRLPVEKSLALIYQILDTLAYAHQQCTYRNLKPVNVMVRPSGKVVLLNFGLTKGTGSDLTDRRSTLGSAPYQAPEQRHDPTISTPQTDLYAVGVLLYQLLTGEVPLGQASPPSRVNHDLPRRLDNVIMRCLALQSGERFAGASETKQAILKAMNPSRLPSIAVAVVLLTLLSALAIGWLSS